MATARGSTLPGRRADQSSETGEATTATDAYCWASDSSGSGPTDWIFGTDGERYSAGLQGSQNLHVELAFLGVPGG